jgi:hypothetical protein
VSGQLHIPVAIGIEVWVGSRVGLNDIERIQMKDSIYLSYFKTSDRCSNEFSSVNTMNERKFCNTCPFCDKLYENL